MTHLPTLEILHTHSADLLLAEVAALLHNIGKFSKEFIFYQLYSAGNSTYRDYETFKYQHVIGIVADIYTDPNTTLDPATIRRLQDMVGTWDIDKTLQYLDQYPQLLQWLRNSNFNLPAPLDDREYALGELIEFQAYKWYRSPDPLISRIYPAGSKVTELLEASHNVASGIDKEYVGGEGKQNNTPIFASSAFGDENEINLSDWQKRRDTFVEALLNKETGERLFRDALITALGDTQRPINEITLWDLSASVAAYYKSALAQAIVTRNWIPRDALRWRLLRVNFDVLGLYAKAVKIADLLAYRDAVDKACETVKKLVEEEYPLGNEVYRDTTGIYFTFPDLELPAELEQEIRHRVEAVEPELAPRIAVTAGDGATVQEQLKGILGKARKEAQQDLERPFDTSNLSPQWQQQWKTLGAGRWEVCPVCRLRPKQESDEICEHCEKRRQPRLNAWKDNPPQTIWLGEIADHNDRVALLVGKFGLGGWLSGDLVQTMLASAAENDPAGCAPKNPSPARLRRVWETCEYFWTQTVEKGILSKNLTNSGIRKHILPNTAGWQAGLYNGKVNGNPIDLFWQHEHNAFLTISNLQAAGEFKQGDTISLEHPETKQKARFQIQASRAAPAPFDRYQAFLPLLTSPDQFLAFVPAADALDIVAEIRKQYGEQFGKVRNRLPLSLGLVFFPRKLPLMAVMDAARQMLVAPVNSELRTVGSVDRNGHVEFENGRTWHVPTVMGDGTVEDLWYPYFELDGAPAAHHTRRFEQNGKTWVHVKNLQSGDKVCISPSTFDFEFLDAASRRFEVHYDKNGRRPARPTHPFSLEDLQSLEQLWHKSIRHLSQTQFKQILQTLETTRERWFGHHGWEKSTKEDKKTFCQFAQDTLANAAWPKDYLWKNNPHKEELVEAAARGTLTDWAELHLEILKEKLREDTSQGETP